MSNDEARIFSDKVKNLPLLPAEHIEALFDSAYTELIAKKTPVSISADGSKVATLETIFQPFAAYFRSFWLGVVTPARLSVFGLPKRTTSDEERYHRAWGTYVGIRPTPIVFMGKHTIFFYCHIAICDICALNL